MPERVPDQGTDRGPQQDLMQIGKRDDAEDATYRDASYLGTDEEDEEEVRDLGFIVDDHDDRRMPSLDEFQHVEDLDTDEALETNRSGRIPHKKQLIRHGVPPDAFATDYHVSHADAEKQEEDFNQTSMLETDPDAEAGRQDYTDETLRSADGELLATDLGGRAPGVVRGLGTRVPQDAGPGGFEVRDNPLMQPEDEPISGERLSDEALGLRDVDQMGSDEELDHLADRGAREIEEASLRSEVKRQKAKGKRQK